MRDFLDVVARPEGAYQTIMSNDLDCLTGAEAASKGSVAPPVLANPGFVYFIGPASGPVKIGFTGQAPRARLATLQAASPAPLSILATVAGSPPDEIAYHKRFAASRIRGEWFDRTPDLLAEIDRLRAPGARVGRSAATGEAVARAYATAERLKRLGHAACVRGAFL